MHSNLAPHGLKRHALSAACGDMDADEFMSTQESIGQIGVVEPIMLFEGAILDGWHRYLAALGLELDCPCLEFQGDAKDARLYVWAKHGARRNWSKGQRATTRALLLAVETAQNAGSATTQQEAAAEAGVSLRTMEQAVALVARGAKPVVDAVVSGDLPLTRAAEIAKLPKKRQVAAIKEPPAPRAPAPRGTTTAPAWRAAGKTPAPQVGVSREKSDEQESRIATLNELNDELQARVAVHFMEGTDDEKAAAADLIASLQKENKQLRHDLDALKDARNTTVSELNEMRRQCAMYRSQLAKFGKKAA